MSIQSVLLVFVGGGLGSVARYIISVITPSNSFPFATFIVNIIGSFFIGLIIQFTINSNGSNTKLLLVTGFCGGFTTFSALTLEVLQLLQQQRTTLALGYIAASLIVGILCVWLGMQVIK